MSLVTETRDQRGVVTVTLADETNRNALSRRLMAELTEVLDAADADPAVRVVVLTNSGRVFCAGADLRESSHRHANDDGVHADRRERNRALTHNSPRPSDDHGDRADRRERPPRADPVAVTAGQLFGRFRRSSKPYVGRIAGHCVAGGMGLAAAMDIAIARDDAKFGFTEVRVGVAPAMISVLCLPKMRRAEAAAAFLRGNRFDAAEAARLGLINAAVPAESLDAAVESVVADLLAGGPAALAACKRLLYQAPDTGFDATLEWAEGLSAELFAGAEAAEGMDAFLNKRTPSWVPDPGEVP